MSAYTLPASVAQLSRCRPPYPDWLTELRSKCHAAPGEGAARKNPRCCARANSAAARLPVQLIRPLRVLELPAGRRRRGATQQKRCRLVQLRVPTTIGSKLPPNSVQFLHPPVHRLYACGRRARDGASTRRSSRLAWADVDWMRVVSACQRFPGRRSTSDRSSENGASVAFCRFRPLIGSCDHPQRQLEERFARVRDGVKRVWFHTVLGGFVEPECHRRFTGSAMKRRSSTARADLRPRAPLLFTWVCSRPQFNGSAASSIAVTPDLRRGLEPCSGMPGSVPLPMGPDVDAK